MVKFRVTAIREYEVTQEQLKRNYKVESFKEGARIDKEQFISDPYLLIDSFNDNIYHDSPLIFHVDVLPDNENENYPGKHRKDDRCIMSWNGVCVNADHEHEPKEGSE